MTSLVYLFGGILQTFWDGFLKSYMKRASPLGENAPLCLHSQQLQECRIRHFLKFKIISKCAGTCVCIYVCTYVWEYTQKPLFLSVCIHIYTHVCECTQKPEINLTVLLQELSFLCFWSKVFHWALGFTSFRLHPLASELQGSFCLHITSANTAMCTTILGFLCF